MTIGTRKRSKNVSHILSSLLRNGTSVAGSLVAIGAILAQVQGCGGDAQGAGGDWGLGDERQNGDAVDTKSDLGEGTYEFHIAVPKGVERSRLVLAAQTSLVVGPGVKLLEPRGEYGTVASMGDLVVKSGADVGAAYGLGAKDVVIEHGAKVHSFVRAAGNVQHGDETTAGIMEHIDNDMDGYRWQVTFPGKNDGDRTSLPGRTLDLAPHPYSKVVVAPASTLVLHTGAYYFESLSVRPGGTLEIDNSQGPVYVWIHNSLGIEGAMHAKSELSNVLFGYAGAASPTITAAFHGTLVAPSAAVKLPGKAHEGAFFAHSIELAPNATVTHQSFTPPTNMFAMTDYGAPAPITPPTPVIDPPIPMATEYTRNDFPNGSYNWSNDVQGIAHDQGHWYISQPGQLWKIPLSASLDADEPGLYDPRTPNAATDYLTVINLPGQDMVDGNDPVLPGGNPSYVADLQGYDHIGDLDFHSFGAANVLFLPLQKQDGTLPPRIAIFNADTLEYLTSFWFPQVPGVDMSSVGGWMAVRPGATPADTVTIWISGTLASDTNAPAFVAYKFDEAHQIVDANGNWGPNMWNLGTDNWKTEVVQKVTSGKLAGTVLATPTPTLVDDYTPPPPILSSPTYAVPRDSAGNVVSVGYDLFTMQGGVFNEDGSLLYTSNGYCDTFGLLHVFQVTSDGTGMLMQGRSANPAEGPTSSSFVYEDHPTQKTTVSVSTTDIFDVVFPPAIVPTAAAWLTGNSAPSADLFSDTFCTGQEAEGLDYFDVRGRNIPGMPDGQLHTFLLSNDAGDDHVWLKHYSTVDTNLAVGQPSFQSSDLAGFGSTASRANDGNTDGNFWDGSVSHTDYGMVSGAAGWPGQYWVVDLGSVRTVDTVNIFNRTDCCTERLSHYNILALDPNSNWYVISDHSGDDTTGIGSFGWPLATPVRTRYVMIAKTDPNYLHLAEVQVMGF